MLLLGSTTGAIPPLSAQPQLSEQSKLVIDGIGPIRVGMTVAEAEQSSGIQLKEQGGRAGNGSCYYLRPQSGPQGLGFMVISNRADQRIVRTQDRIARVDVYRDSRITTLSGAKIGDTEAQVRALYPGRIQETPHKYTSDQGGHYLTYVPKDAADQNYRLIFETLNGRITAFRAGKRPEVDFVEGCA
ncbi:MAG TPA: hypothetical protein V6D19_09035 [Stenomitos sp.]